MKILIDGRLYGLENAGLGRYSVNLIRELVKLDRKNEYIILLRRKYYESLTFPSNWKKVLADFGHYTVSEQTGLPGIIARQNPDVVHFLHFNVPIFYKGKYIVTIHDLLMQNHRGAKATTLPFYLYYPKQVGSKLVFKKAVASAQRIIVPSNAVKDEVCSYFKVDCEKVNVIYEGVDEAITGDNKKYKLESPYFLYVGSAYPHKNLERAVKAILELNRGREKKYILAIACARGIFLERLEKMVKRNNAGEFVKLLGFVPDEDLGRLYKESLGFVYPSLSEGFGLPGLEAMSKGTIVLASDIPVFKEVYKDKVVYFNPYKIESIEDAMESVINMSREKKRKMIDEGRRFVKRYSWRRMARETLEIYEECYNGL